MLKSVLNVIWYIIHCTKNTSFAASAKSTNRIILTVDGKTRRFFSSFLDAPGRTGKIFLMYVSEPKYNENNFQKYNTGGLSLFITLITFQYTYNEIEAKYQTLCKYKYHEHFYA